VSRSIGGDDGWRRVQYHGRWDGDRRADAVEKDGGGVDRWSREREGKYGREPRVREVKVWRRSGRGGVRRGEVGAVRGRRVSRPGMGVVSVPMGLTLRTPR